MPTLSIVTKNNQFIFQSTVSMPTSFTKRKVYGALLDTGAQISMISPKIVSEVQLKTIGDAFVTPVNGEVIQTPRYRVRLDIPIDSIRSLPGGKIEPFTDLRGQELEVAELPYQPTGYDVLMLMGMDFIALWHITMQGGHLILSI